MRVRAGRCDAALRTRDQVRRPRPQVAAAQPCQRDTQADTTRRPTGTQLPRSRGVGGCPVLSLSQEAPIRRPLQQARRAGPRSPQARGRPLAHSRPPGFCGGGVSYGGRDVRRRAGHPAGHHASLAARLSCPGSLASRRTWRLCPRAQTGCPFAPEGRAGNFSPTRSPAPSQGVPAGALSLACS